MIHRLVLASRSPRRRELLARLTPCFEMLAPDVDEGPPDPNEDPVAYAVRLATRKARAATSLARGRTVLAADTIVVIDGRVLGKPRNADEARAMLQVLRGREHEVTTGLAVVDARTAGPRTGAVTTRVTMRDYSDAEIDAYVASGDPFDKAGGYAIQHPRFRPAAAIDRCYPNVVGLPLCEAARLLALTPPPGCAASCPLPEPLPVSPMGAWLPQ